MREALLMQSPTRTRILFWTSLNPLIESIIVQLHPVIVKCHLKVLASPKFNISNHHPLGSESNGQHIMALESYVDLVSTASEQDEDGDEESSTDTSNSTNIQSLGLNELMLPFSTNNACMTMRCAGSDTTIAISPSIICGEVFQAEEGDDFRTLVVNQPVYLTPILSSSTLNGNTMTVERELLFPLLGLIVCVLLVFECCMVSKLQGYFHKREQKRRMFKELQGEWLLGTTIQQRLDSVRRSVIFEEVDCTPVSHVPHMLPDGLDPNRLMQLIREQQQQLPSVRVSSSSTSL